jgi:hypothetical protein
MDFLFKEICKILWGKERWNAQFCGPSTSKASNEQSAQLNWSSPEAVPFSTPPEWIGQPG